MILNLLTFFINCFTVQNGQNNGQGNSNSGGMNGQNNGMGNEVMPSASNSNEGDRRGEKKVMRFLFIQNKKWNFFIHAF